MGTITFAFTYNKKYSNFNKPFGFIAFGVLFLIILVSTYLHHFQPQVLNVPSNTDVSTWRNPTFDQTLIYQRMTKEERESIRTNGLPGEMGLGVHFLKDIGIIMIGLLCFLHGRKHYGFWMASCFFIGSFVFTGLEETCWILAGRFFGSYFTNPFGIQAHGSYWFTIGGFWFFETPVIACIGWYFIAYSCVLVAGKAFPEMNLIGRAAIGGLIAMSIDLWQDPVATSPELMSWVWAEADFFLFFGIPLYNFIGWFLLIFLFAIFWERLPEMENKWGRSNATLIFFGICIMGAVCAALFIFLFSLIILGKIMLFFGINDLIQIPKGW